MTESEKQNLVAWLHQQVLSAVPKATTVEKYGGTLFTLRPEEKEGQFCGVFACKAHVHLAFSRGVDLDDPQGLLEGGGKFRRHLNFRSADDVPAKDLRRFLKAAAKL